MKDSPPRLQGLTSIKLFLILSKFNGLTVKELQANWESYIPHNTIYVALNSEVRKGFIEVIKEGKESKRYKLTPSGNVALDSAKQTIRELYDKL